MTSSDRVLARRYTRALFQMAVQRRQEEKIAKELTDAHKALLGQMNVLNHPMVPSGRKKALLRQVLRFHESSMAAGFLDLLIDKKRLALLPLAAVEFGRILDEKQGRLRAHAKSAAELSPQEKEKLRDKLKKFSGRDVDLEVKVEEELLGGVVIRMDDWVIDGSLKGKLRRLGAQLADGAYTAKA